MDFSLFFVLISFLINSSIQYNYRTEYIDVPLDHFGYSTNKTFQLRYLINDSYIIENTTSPIFFYTGNEGDIELFANNTGFMWKLGKEFRALIVFAEHRYYGKSLPFQNKSFETPHHLGYLTSEQALADYATLIMNLNPSKSRPVIVFGGSYGGMLAAWFRMKYPHIVRGALASSAPILQFTGLTDCNVFSRILSSVFTSESDSCSKNIQNSWNMFKNFSSTDLGREKLNKAFNFCKNITKPDDIKIFFDYLEDVYSNLAMVNYPYETSFLAPLPAFPVHYFCSFLDKDYEGDKLLQQMQKAINLYSNYTGKVKCLNYKSAFDPSMGTTAWDFQSCTEMVMPMCVNGNDDIFEKKDWNLISYSNDCFKKFNVRPREKEMIIRYGGCNIESASNIIFSNGLLDPWSGGGVLKTSNNRIHILIIPEGAHHIDLRADNINDSMSVIQTREKERSIIKSWIKSF